MKENNLRKLSKLTDNLTKSFVEFNEFFENSEEGDKINEVIQCKYPFAGCFNELTFDVTKWNCEVQSKINKELEQDDLKCTLKKLAMTDLTPRELKNILFADFYDMLCTLDKEELGVDTIVKIIEANGMTKSQYEDRDYLVEKFENHFE